MTNTYYEIKKSYIYLLKKSSSFNYPIAQLNPIATNKYLTILYQSNDDILNLASRVLNSTRLSSRTFSSTLQQIIKNYKNKHFHAEIELNVEETYKQFEDIPTFLMISSIQLHKYNQFIASKILNCITADVFFGDFDETYFDQLSQSKNLKQAIRIPVLFTVILYTDEWTPWNSTMGLPTDIFNQIDIIMKNNPHDIFRFVIVVPFVYVKLDNEELLKHYQHRQRIHWIKFPEGSLFLMEKVISIPSYLPKLTSFCNNFFTSKTNLALVIYDHKKQNTILSLIVHAGFINFDESKESYKFRLKHQNTKQNVDCIGSMFENTEERYFSFVQHVQRTLFTDPKIKPDMKNILRTLLSF